MPDTIKILLAEDQQLVRSSLQQLLCHSKYEIIASVSNGEEVMKFLHETRIFPDLCLLDILMPEMDGIECTQLVKSLYPDIKVVLLTSYDQATYLEQALIAHADGYMLKETTLESFYGAIELVLDGQFVAPKRIVSSISSRLQSLIELERNSKYNKLTSLLKHYSETLDNKDMEIIKLIWQGWTNRMIAEDLYISEGTVKNYVSRLYKKLNINTRSELMQLLVES